MSPEIVSELAPTGVLRAGINLSNFLLVTGRSATGDPQGVAPDLAGEIASRLGVPIKYVPFKSPGELADAAGTGVWDIGLIGAEPQRAEKIVFTAAYCEIEATYLVPAGSKLRTIADVDASGVRIAVTARIIDGKFTAVQQAVGTSPKNKAAAAYLRGFVEEAKSSGLVAKLIARHNVRGLSVAPKVSQAAPVVGRDLPQGNSIATF